MELCCIIAPFKGSFINSKNNTTSKTATITNEIKFKTKLNDNIASADIVVDRTTFDIRYGSGSFFDNLGDKMIYDDFKLSVSLNY